MAANNIGRSALSDPTAGKAWLSTLVAILPIAVAAALGSLATVPNLEPWYAGLAKPSFTPPNWIFGPTWTVLYVLMASAVWRVMRLPRGTPCKTLAIFFFFAQLAANAAWSWMFFGAQSPALGLINIVPQWAAVALAWYLFRQLDRIAGCCLLPLWIWVSFASILNLAIWRLNS
jgi:translocator protein